MERKSLVPNMKFFVNSCIKRNIAFAVLLVWLFALASGVANACFLETPQSHPRQAATASHAPADSLFHASAPAGRDDDSDSTKESCLKVCDDGTNAVTKAHSGVDHSDPGPAPLVAILWAGSAPVISASRRVDDLAIPLCGPPLRVRYSRLAL